MKLHTLEEIVNTDNKDRYSFNDDKTKVRANQGHSVKNVDIKFNIYNGKNVFYHETATKYLEGIEEKKFNTRNQTIRSSFS